MAAKETILKAVSATVHQFDPEAEIILYGSQARGDSHEESDWDFLIIANKESDFSEWKNALRQAPYLIEVENSVVISVVIKSRAWLEDMAETPFLKEVRNDGVVIL